MGDQKTTTTRELGTQSAEAGNFMQMLQQLAEQAGVQLGDLGDIAGGDLSATPEDRRLIEESAGAASDIARRQAEDAYTFARGQTEETLISRGVDDSTIGAVTEAIQGKQYQQQLADIASQQQGQVASGLMQMPFQRAEAQISANQAILQRILGGSGQVLNYDLQTRLGSTTQEETKPFDYMSTGAGLGQIGATVATGGAG